MTCQEASGQTSHLSSKMHPLEVGLTAPLNELLGWWLWNLSMFGVLWIPSAAGVPKKQNQACIHVSKHSLATSIYGNYSQRSLNTLVRTNVPGAGLKGGMDWYRVANPDWYMYWADLPKASALRDQGCAWWAQREREGVVWNHSPSRTEMLQRGRQWVCGPAGSPTEVPHRDPTASCVTILAWVGVGRLCKGMVRNPLPCMNLYEHWTYGTAGTVPPKLPWSWAFVSGQLGEWTPKS